jgi:DNA-binding MarR family transcriptional regulator
LSLSNKADEDLLQSVFIIFIQTARAVMKYYNAYLYRKVHLSIIKLATLTVLSLNEGRMNPSEIAKVTYTERHNITALVSRMSREGLVKTERNPSDRRLVNVTITDKGREVLTRATPVVRAIIAQVMASISEDDASALEKPLKILRQNVHQELNSQYAKSGWIPDMSDIY